MLLSPAHRERPPPLSPGLLCPPSPLHAPSAEERDRERPVIGEEKYGLEKELEKEARRELKRDKNGRVSAWVTSQLSLSLLTSSVEDALTSVPAVGATETEKPVDIPRPSADSTRSGPSVKELEGMLVQHMEDERARFKRLAGTAKGSMSLSGAIPVI